MIKWNEEIDIIKLLLSKGTTLEEIGNRYNVSKQRVYQVLQKYGVDTPNRKRETFLKDKDPKYYWLNKMLVMKGFIGGERTVLLQTMVLPDVCPILGIKLNYDGTGVEGYTRADNSPSIDRIDSDIGYTANNIAVISWRANRIKNNGTADEHKKIADWMKKHLQSM